MSDRTTVEAHDTPTACATASTPAGVLGNPPGGDCKYISDRREHASLQASSLADKTQLNTVGFS
jgi:hypothetical protein